MTTEDRRRTNAYDTPQAYTARITGARRDRDRIERELGTGGMATVYLAHDIEHDRHVAITVLHPELGTTLGVDRFLSERWWPTSGSRWRCARRAGPG